MQEPSVAERIIRCLAGHARAAGIMGDLTEMAATRGRLWFWTAYARTLFSLTWRSAPVAFVFALAGKRFFVTNILPISANQRIGHLVDAGLFGSYNMHIRLITWNLSMVLARWLIFAVFFAVVRFGLRNRLSQLICGLFILVMPVYSLRPWVMDLSGLLTVTTLAAALLTPLWRRPMAVLIATSLIAITTTVGGLYLLGLVFHRNFLWLTGFDVAIYDAVSLALAVIVCLYLHCWLLERRPLTDGRIAE